jgi:hypothetical protein
MGTFIARTQIPLAGSVWPTKPTPIATGAGPDHSLAKKASAAERMLDSVLS